MGFMRKAFFLGTVGLSGAVGVRANSKKQRAANAAEAQVRLQKQVIKQQAASAAATRAAPVARVLATNVPAVEEQFDVILTEVDPAEKIATMKLVYQVSPSQFGYMQTNRRCSPRNGEGADWERGGQRAQGASGRRACGRRTQAFGRVTDPRRR